MPQFDTSTFASQIFWLTVAFVTLYLVMWRVVAPKIADVLDARRRRIDQAALHELDDAALRVGREFLDLRRAHGEVEVGADEHRSALVVC